MKELKGKKIHKIFISDDKESIVFVDYEGNMLTYHAEGDCCSYSWIEHIAGVNAMIGQTVLEVEDVDLSDVDITEEGQKGHDCITVYGWKFKCSGGHVDLEFRNDSNGYYGGWMQFSSEEKWNQDVTDKLKPLTEDF